MASKISSYQATTEETLPSLRDAESQARRAASDVGAQAADLRRQVVAVTEQVPVLTQVIAVAVHAAEIARTATQELVHQTQVVQVAARDAATAANALRSKAAQAFDDAARVAADAAREAEGITNLAAQVQATEGWSGALATLGSSVANTASDWWTVARQEADRLGESLPPPVRARWSLFLAGTRHFGGWVSETWQNGGPHLSGDSQDYKKTLTLHKNSTLRHQSGP